MNRQGPLGGHNSWYPLATVNAHIAKIGQHSRTALKQYRRSLKKVH